MATIDFKEWQETGVVPAESAGGVTSIRFHNTLDSAANLSTDNPLIRPPSASADNYSFNKFIDVHVTTSGFSSISSVKIDALNGGNVDASGRIGPTFANEVILNYAFQRKALKTDNPVAADFQEKTDGAGADPVPTGINGSGVPIVAWANGTAQDWGGLGTFTLAEATADGGEFSLISATQNTLGSEWLLLNLRVTDDATTGGALDTFNLTLTYNEV